MTEGLRKNIVLSAAAISCLMFVLAAGASAQQPQPSPERPMDSDTSKDDILLLVNVTAKELKFDAVPSTTVEFPGTPKRTTIWITDRQNLPEKLEPGVTYRNIGIQLRISSRFEDIERIVREALGEEPIAPEPERSRQPSSATPPRIEPTRIAAMHRPHRKK